MLEQRKQVIQLRDRYYSASILLNNAIHYSDYTSDYTRRVDSAKDKRFYAYRHAVLAFIERYPHVYIG